MPATESLSATGQGNSRVVRSGIDWILEILSLLGLFAVFGLALLYWDQIPEGPPRRSAIIPQTVWTVKNGLWLVMALNVLTYLGLTIGGQFQKLIQIPDELDRVSPTIRPMMFSMVIVLKAVLMLFAVYLTWALVNVAQGRGGFFSGWSLTAFVLAIPLPLLLYTVKLRRYQR